MVYTDQNTIYRKQYSSDLSSIDRMVSIFKAGATITVVWPLYMNHNIYPRQFRVQIWPMKKVLDLKKSIWTQDITVKPMFGIPHVSKISRMEPLLWGSNESPPSEDTYFSQIINNNFKLTILKLALEKLMLHHKCIYIYICWNVQRNLLFFFMIQQTLSSICHIPKLKNYLVVLQGNALPGEVCQITSMWLIDWMTGFNAIFSNISALKNCMYQRRCGVEI